MDNATILEAAKIIQRIEHIYAQIREHQAAQRDAEYELAILRREVPDPLVLEADRPHADALMVLKARYHALELTDFREFRVYQLNGEWVAQSFYKYSGMGHGRYYAVMGADLYDADAKRLSADTADEIAAAIRRQLWEAAHESA